MTNLFSNSQFAEPTSSDFLTKFENAAAFICFSIFLTELHKMEL